MLRMGLGLASHLGQTHVPSSPLGSTPQLTQTASAYTTPPSRTLSPAPPVIPDFTSPHLTLPRLTLHGNRPAFASRPSSPSILPSYSHTPLFGRDEDEENVLLALEIQKPGAVPKRSHHPTSAST
ncbi:hypothetical protein CORC01_07099 [Colletotrichum orchidophilum]|uniref:Uncharacterized protein n=1 Tax=Colletotrichum orchidophilum TaxID=1209926 RepID=A0A1G4B8I0_9PEZI|nr:uncharacterized protein CORC01_07099 [Colletotrichum orchidophilum]OHE97684.1 hypothetical protein CORC01_07099 [Colletotrichum orchidophilum]